MKSLIGMVSTYRVLNLMAGFLLALAIFLFTLPGIAYASGNPARSETVAAGSYIIAVNFFQDPPYVDQPLDITVVPQDSALHLSGTLIAQPGPGTDATPLRSVLSSDGHTLQGSVHIPVQGAWQIKIELNGPRGAGEANIPVTVGAPGAIPSWLAWLIGSSPLVGVAFWVWHQHRYRQRLVAAHGA